MVSLTRFSNEELKARLKKLQERFPLGSRAARSKELQHDLQVHQIELEMQNRELREAQQDLQAARDRYADLYDFAPVGYMTLDPRGRIREINLTGATMLGVVRGDVIGQPFAAWLVGTEIGAFSAHLRTAAQARERAAVELHLKRRDRGPLAVRLESVADSGTHGGCRTAMTDITEQKERELAEREREAELAHLARISTLGVVASTIAHEITQPLTAIVSYAAVAAHLVRTNPSDTAAVLEYLQKLSALGQRAGAIVHSISDFSRKGDLLRAPLALNRVVHDAVPLLTAAARRAGVEITFDLAEDLPRVIGNIVEIEQVIVNLVMNAIESIESNESVLRQVSVRTARVDDAAQLSVTDTGGGLSPDVAERMFQPLFSTKAKGHGMGLALCRTIIRSHDGDIWATPNPGGGAVVTFSIPIGQRIGADATDATRSTTSVSTARR